VSGFDENGESILYAGDIQISVPGQPGFNVLDDRSKVFVWAEETLQLEDGNLVPSSPSWYVNISTSTILEEQTDLDNDGYLLKRFDYAFRYKLNPNPTTSEAVFASLDFMFDRSAVKIIRATDKRKADDRVYRIVLDGYVKERGLRRPQPYYVMEKQVGVAGFPLNGSFDLIDNPLTITQVRTYDEVFRPGKIDVQFPGTYVTYLTQGSRARDVFTGDFYPSQDRDYPELTEDPDNSVTKVALELMKGRPGVNFSTNLAPSVSPIIIKTTPSATTTGIRIGLRRPSVIRASGHTWEWTGYLNYDTAFPTFQGDPLEQDLALGKIIVEEKGGRVYATGMNEEGNYYLGTTVFDLRSGEQFAIPLAADGEAGNVTNQILNNVIVRNTLLMQDGSSLVMGRDTTLFFSNDTVFKSLTTGDIVASRNPPAVYATNSRAGIVQLADQPMIRGAKGTSATGVSDKAVVTAFDLAQELDVRFENSVAGGSGVTVTSALVELPGGDPNDPTDDITQFSINIGLPLNTDTVPFSAIRLGSQSGQIVNTISTAVDKATARSSALVTETALRNYIIGSDQIEDGSVIEPKLATNSVSTSKILDEAVTSVKLASGSVTESKISNSAVTTAKINNLAVTEAKLADSAVTTAKINNLAVTEAKLAASAVTDTKIASNAVTTAKINSNAVTYAKMQNVSTANRLLGSTTANGTVSEVQVATNMVANGAITASKLSGQQSGTAPIYGIRHFVEIAGEGAIAVSGSGSLTANYVGGGTYDISFTSNAPPNANYIVIATSTDVEGDHAISVFNKTSSGFRIAQKDIENGGGSGLGVGGDQAGSAIMVIY
jgi:hypothetical protein